MNTATSDLRWRAALRGVALATATFVSGAHAQELSGPALVKALQQGGYVVVMRHAHAPATPPAPREADAANRGRERQLDDAGRASATAMGKSVKALRIPFAEVLSSPTYRARQTVQLAGLPQPHLAPELGDRGRSMQAASGGQGAWLRQRASQPPRLGTNTLIVTHAPNIAAAFGEAGAGLGDGGALVFRPAPGYPPRLVGRVAIAEWPTFAAP